MTQQSELSLKQLTQLFLRNWILFASLFILLGATASVIYSVKVPFAASVSLSVKDSKNSVAQAFANNFTNIAPSLADGKKGNTPLARQIDQLKSTSTLKEIYKSIFSDELNNDLSLAESKGRKILLKEWKVQAADQSDEQIKHLSRLESILEFKAQTDSRLLIETQDMEPEVALYMANKASQVAQKKLTSLESEELELILVTMAARMSAIEKAKNKTFNQLQSFNQKKSNILSITSGQKVTDYLSDLMIRKQEVRMKINENLKQMNELKSIQTNYRVSSAYGRGGQLELLQAQNKSLQYQLSEIDSAIAQVSKVASDFPTAQLSFQELEQKYKNEEQEYIKLRDIQNKAQMQLQLIPTKFEIIDPAREDLVKPVMSLSALLSLALILSFLLGAIILYLYTIWDPETRTETRNVVIINGQHLDPRVVVEDSKIKFRLKSDGHIIDDDTDFGEKKLTFRLFDKKNDGLANENN